MLKELQSQHLEDWQKREELAEKMLPLIGKLYRDQKVVIQIYGRSMVHGSPIDILKGHRWVRQMENNELSIMDSFPILEEIVKQPLKPSVIDLGKLAVKYLSKAGSVSLSDFVKSELAILESASPGNDAQDVVLYGFGRIGRLLARILIDETGENKLRLRAVVVRKGKGDDLAKRANLLRRDSVHGNFQGTITIDRDKEAIIANGNLIKVIYANSPDSIDYTEYGIQNALVVDNTGVWRDEEGLGLHLKSKGTAKAILTAPGKGDIKNIVYGVNHQIVDPSDTILSAASCTTNAITPVLQAVHEEYGIDSGHVETIHSYTNDQNLIDNYHKGNRRGRGAALNMVLTETGAAKAVAKALPDLKGKLTGNAIRVPTPNVSMAILNLNLNKDVNKESLNEYLRDTSLYSSLKDQIDYTASWEVVSTDLVGSTYAGIVDSQATIAEGNRCVLYVWYDNEFGYSYQVVRLLKDLSGQTSPYIPSSKA